MKYIEVDLSKHYKVESAILKCYVRDIAEECAKGSCRPAMVILPGGGYLNRSTREKEPIAFKYLAEGYNAFILEYSVSPSRFPTQILQVGAAISYIKANAKELRVDKNKIALSGFSAGGHLAASYSCLYDSIVKDGLNLSAKELSVNAVVLGYPVISSGKYAHAGTFNNLCSDDEELKKAVSVENLVGKQTPPTFIFHTVADQTVPVENSLLYSFALKKNEVPFELHIFNDGKHGLSTCEDDVAFEDREWSYIEREVSAWIGLSFEFLAVNLKYDKFKDNKRNIGRFNNT